MTFTFRSHFFLFISLQDSLAMTSLFLMYREGEPSLQPLLRGRNSMCPSCSNPLPALCSLESSSLPAAQNLRLFLTLQSWGTASHSSSRTALSLLPTWLHHPCSGILRLPEFTRHSIKQQTTLTKCPGIWLCIPSVMCPASCLAYLSLM